MDNPLCADEACTHCGEVGPADNFSIFTEPIVGMAARRVYCKNVTDCALRVLRYTSDLVRQDLDAARMLRHGAA